MLGDLRHTVAAWHGEATGVLKALIDELRYTATMAVLRSESMPPQEALPWRTRDTQYRQILVTHS